MSQSTTLSNDLVCCSPLVTALTDLLKNAPVRIALFDRKMRYLASSRLWNETYLKGHRDPRGLCHYDLLPNQPSQWRKFHEMGWRGEVTERQFDKFTDHEGNVQYLNWSVSPHIDETGQVAFLTIVTEDVTSRWMAYQALEESQERYELAVRATNNGIYDWNLLTGSMYWSPQFCDMLGLEHDCPASQEFWRPLVLKEDLDRISLELEEAVKRPEIDFYTTRYRIRHADGHLVPILARSVMKRDASGRVVRLVGANVDLSTIFEGRDEGFDAFSSKWKGVAGLLDKGLAIGKSLESLDLKGREGYEIRQLTQVMERLSSLFNAAI